MIEGVTLYTHTQEVIRFRSSAEPTSCLKGMMEH